ncbi:MAG: Fmu (Sun) domain-containing protein [Desulfovibrionaceae bacterium]|nr:Fmu (Sun) domain-containing protein [Desulfovibrionaceae bacterium]MBF0512577.1 Fmu (Sun) domain-containing protein [Desulfovibrionaceae bacterium]
MKSASPSPARDAALASALACLGPDKFDLQAALHGVLQQGGLDSRDAGLATELAYGFLRLKGRADFVLSAFLKDPGKLPYEVKLVLGLAAFELTHLDKSPAHAVVNWAVGAVKARFGDGLARLANAVLRRVADLGQSPRDEHFYRKGAASEEEFQARFYSCPRWIVEAIGRDHGPARCAALLAAQTVQPPLGLRFNALAPGAAAAYEDLASLHVHKGRFPTMILEKGERPDNTLDLEARGVLSRQSAASQLIVAALEPAAWPGPVLDACAGRGGKACLLLESGVTLLAACDLSRHRLRQLGRELDRLGLPPVPRIVADAQAPQPWRKPPGTILIDAPCTGLGVLSRRPDSKWKRSRADAAALVRLQAAILGRAFDALAPGGRLAYVTCTLLARENEQQIRNLAANRTGVKILRQETTPDSLELGEFFYGALIEKT